MESGRILAGACIAACVTVLAPAGFLGIAATAVFSTDLELTSCSQDGSSGGGSVLIDQQPVGADSMLIARTIVTVVMQRHLPRRAAVIAIATGLVESNLRNLDHGDRDSLGVFQQRPSQGWGSRTEILNPVHATNTFLDHLVAVPGWEHLLPGQAEQTVQRSGFPGRYGPREPQAAGIVAKFWQGPDNPPPQPNPGQQVEAKTACPDQDGGNLPPPGGFDPRKLPPGYRLPTEPHQARAVSYALAQLGKAYRWGAKGPEAFDCSGLMLAAWAAAGVGVPAGTTSQVHAGRPVAGVAQLEPGDLVFIPGSLGSPANPRHVGMFAGSGLIVNAYDETKGVILEPLTAWQTKVSAIRRVAPPRSGPGG
ncbi:C40 family peptidase [Sciscionella marina]|uniref:C40 family peptidase n=1 Tax=Sciscionella marina TaxID=508770 RepID=UPI000360FC2D|nr:NlpC/P60 family protein [Sciscionella marina]